jgi:ankyrin repeat protein
MTPLWFIGTESLLGPQVLEWKTDFGFYGRLLRTPDVNINVQDSNGSTPLALAAQRGSGTIVKLLLEHRACTAKGF